jgi:hypothetical protein
MAGTDRVPANVHETCDGVARGERRHFIQIMKVVREGGLSQRDQEVAKTQFEKCSLEI